MPKKILIVDDNQLNTMLLEQILADEGFETAVLNNGLEVLELARNLQPDAVLLDIMMPEIDGFEVCRQLKAVPETKNIPIIMVTAKTEGEDLKKAFSLGAFDYIKKPIEELEVLARLHSALLYREQQQKLEEMAMKDGLTGLYNHNLTLELLDKECEKAKRNRQGLALLMIDLDHFKRVNDQYGHKAGDSVLKEVASILSSHSRDGDIVGRFGGEEFCVILPDITLQNTEEVAERLREAIEDHNFPVDGFHIRLTTSIGIAYKSPEDDSNCNKIFTESDKALYQAKFQGRNQVVAHIL